MIEGVSNNNQENEDGNLSHNHPKPRVAFLELTNNREEIERRGSPDMSPSRSPSNSRKPFIPLLDFSTLHEHVDSTGKPGMLEFNVLMVRFNGGENCSIVVSLLYKSICSAMKKQTL